MTHAEIENRTTELLNPIIEEFGFDLWDVEYVKEGGSYFLRAYIDKEGGITIDDCVDVSRKLSDKLDEHDFIDDEYTLEVSSPGVERTLKKNVDFEKSIGKDVYIKLYNPVDIDRGNAQETNTDRKGKKQKSNKQKEFTGTLMSFDKETVTVSLHNSADDNQNKADDNQNKTNDTESLDNKQSVFNRKDIALIRLYVEF